MELKTEEQEDGSLVVRGFEDEAPAGAPAAEPAAAPAPAAEPAGTEAPAGEEDDATHQAEDEAAAQEGRSEVEREAIRARRRQERAEKKERAREREDDLRNQINALAAQNEQLREQVAVVTQKVSGSELAQIDTAIAQAKQAHDHFQGVMARAITAQDGDTATDAAKRMGQAEARFNQLQGLKQRMTTTREQPSPVDPLLKANAETWMAKNAWFKPGAADSDNKVASAVDKSVMDDGFDPRTPAYWQELDRRLGRYLPHRVKAGSIPGTPREKPRSPVSGSGREGAGAPGGGSEYRLSAERVQALKEAGVWDDAAKRSDAIRRYREHDKNAAQR